MKVKPCGDAWFSFILIYHFAQLSIMTGVIVDTYRMYVITPTLLDRDKEKNKEKEQIFNM